jgi:hypothetical protein
MLLDGYVEHARGTQAQLLVRLQKGTLETYAEMETRTHSCATAHTVPMDDDAVTTPSNPLATMSRPASTRWKNVNFEEIQQTSQSATKKYYH